MRPSAIIAAALIIGVFLLVRWAEGAEGLGGFFSGSIAGVTFCLLAYIGFLRWAVRKGEEVRAQRRGPSLPKVPVPEGELTQYTWNLRRLDGSSASLHDFMREIVFVNIWSTLCLPCVAELASIERLRKILEPEGLVFVCVATDPDLHELQAWVASHQVELPIFALVDDEIPPVFDSDGIPATFILGADGRVAFKHEGAAHWDHPRVVSFLRGLLMGGVFGPRTTAAAGTGMPSTGARLGPSS